MNIDIKDKKLEKILSNKKAFLFDLDGTLIDTEPLHLKALQKTLQQFEYKMNPEEMKTQFHGVADHVIYKGIFQNYQKPSLEYFIEVKCRHLKEIITNYSIANFIKLTTPGAMDFLKLLYKNSQPIGLISASEKDIVDVVLKKLEISLMFNTLRSREDTFLSKPSPSPYLSAMRELKVQTFEVIIFEDSFPGLKSATQTNAQVIQVCQNNPFLRNNPEFKQLIKIDNFMWQNYST